MEGDFGGDPSIVGRTIRVSQQPFVVLGVARPDFTGSERFIRADLWTDLWNEQQIEGYSFINNRRNQNIWVMGRRLPGVTAGQAQADLNRVARRSPTNTRPMRPTPPSASRPWASLALLLVAGCAAFSPH